MLMCKQIIVLWGKFKLKEIVKSLCVVRVSRLVFLRLLWVRLPIFVLDNIGMTDTLGILNKETEKNKIFPKLKMTMWCMQDGNAKQQLELKNP